MKSAPEPREPLMLDKTIESMRTDAAAADKAVSTGDLGRTRDSRELVESAGVFKRATDSMIEALVALVDRYDALRRRATAQLWLGLLVVLTCGALVTVQALALSRLDQVVAALEEDQVRTRELAQRLLQLQEGQDLVRDELDQPPSVELVPDPDGGGAKMIVRPGPTASPSAKSVEITIGPAYPPPSGSAPLSPRFRP